MAYIFIERASRDKKDEGDSENHCEGNVSITGCKDVGGGGEKRGIPVDCHLKAQRSMTERRACKESWCSCENQVRDERRK